MISMITTIPIELSSFETTKEDYSCRLSWTAIPEGLSAYFDIQRSTDGISFTDLGRIYAGNNTATTTLYSFKDLQPSPGINNYRLRMVSRDGHCYYSAIRALAFGFQCAGPGE